METIDVAYTYTLKSRNCRHKGSDLRFTLGTPRLFLAALLLSRLHASAVVLWRLVFGSVVVVVAAAAIILSPGTCVLIPPSRETVHRNGETMKRNGC